MTAKYRQRLGIDTIEADIALLLKENTKQLTFLLDSAKQDTAIQIARAGLHRPLHLLGTA